MDPLGNDPFNSTGYVSEPDPATPALQTPSMLTLDYYRAKVTEFQATLIAMNETGAQLYDAGTHIYGMGDAELIAEYESLQNEFNMRRDMARTAAEGLRFASEQINAMGITFPSVQMPMGLGVVQLAPLAAAAGVLAIAAAVVTWASTFWQRVAMLAEKGMNLLTISMLPESERAPALEQFRRLEMAAIAAEESANTSPLGNVATIAKWAALGLLGYFAFKAWKETR